MKFARTIALAATTAALFAVPSTATAATAAGSCTNPNDATAADVSYRWQSRTTSWRARPALATVGTRSLPGGGVRNGAATQQTVHTGIQAWYLVLDARQVGATCWLRLRLPSEPTSRGGWVDRNNLIVQRAVWQLEIDLSDRRVRMYRAGVRKLDAPVVIGRAATPTPLTMVNEPFAMYDAKRGMASDFTGTWQLATTARSAVDPDLGRIGIHGRGGASLADPLGSASSHGCLRAANATVNRIVQLAGVDGLLGAAVVITR